MIEKITISGFGPWTSQAVFYLKRLTILLGDNDSGKSAALKAFSKLDNAVYFPWHQGCGHQEGWMIGAGKSRLLHILQTVHGFDGDELLLLEHPDAFLHPSLQADLADILIDLLSDENGLQIVVETHSEFFVTRIRRRIAEGKFHPSLLSIYHCQVRDKQAIAQPLAVTEYGDMVDWPAFLFGDLTGDLIQTAKAASQRRL